MAATRIIVMSAVFSSYLYIYAIIDSGNSANSTEETFTTLISTDSHLMEYPSRNSGDFPRRSRKPSISTVWKLKAGMHIFKLSLIAYLIILLSGDVSINPGPQLNSASAVTDDFDFPTKRGLRISHLNVRSIIHKMDSIRLMLKNKPFDIFSVSETWLNSDIFDSELAIEGYSFTRQDRSDRRGGGCMVYVRENLPYCIRPDLLDESIESCVIEINRPKCKTLFLWNVYRAPDLSLEIFLEGLNSKMALLPSNAEVCLLGDFNVDFFTKQRTHGYALKRKLALFANTHQLNQLIETPTRITEQSASTIDLLFINNKHRVAESGVMSAHISDHLLIYCVLKSGVPKGPGKSIYYRSYKHYCKERFLVDLRHENWDSLGEINDVNEAASIWTKMFLSIAYKHAPMKQSRIKGNDVPWMSSGLKNSMNERNRLYRKAIKSKYPAD